MPDPVDPFRVPDPESVTVIGAPPGVAPAREAIEHLRCPDCIADLTFVWQSGPDAGGRTVWKPTIRHDDTCPIMQEIDRRRHPPD